jgi:hypothetical protein
VGDDTTGGLPEPPDASLPSADAPNGPPLPAAPRAWGDDDPPVEVPTPAPVPARRHVGVLVAMTILVVIVIVAVVASAGGDGGLPDRLGGQVRVTEGPAVEMLDAVGDIEVEGVSFTVAMYGPVLNPAYMVMTFEGDIPGGSEGMLESMPTGMFSDADAQIDFSRKITAVVDGVEFVCVPATNTTVGVEMSMCLFARDGGGGVVLGLASGDLDALMATTQELVAETG